MTPTMAPRTPLPLAARFSPNPGITIDRAENTFRITARLQISGHEVEPEWAATVRDTIKRYWDGHTFPDGTTVKCDVAVTYRAPGQRPDPNAFQIDMVRNFRRSNVKPEKSKLFGLLGVEPSSMELNLNQPNALTWIVAHEFGHCLKMEDKYVDRVVGDRAVSDPKPGYRGNLMGEFGGKLSSQNLRDLHTENTGLFDNDNQVREWVRHHGREIGSLSTNTKIQMIDKLIGGRFDVLEKDDVTTIDTICRGFSSESERASVRRVIEPKLRDIQGIGQRTEVRASLTRWPAAVRPPPSKQSRVQVIFGTPTVELPPGAATRPRAATLSPGSGSLLKQGMRGESVRRLQERLGIKADGIYGPATKRAVIDFQKKHGLATDGIAGKNTFSALNRTTGTLASTTLTSGSSSLLKTGMRGDEVRKLQERLGIKADGIYGPNTKRAVIDFQKKHGLSADGIAGRNTFSALDRTQVLPSYSRFTSSSLLKEGMRGDEVRRLQERLGIKADGIYGPATKRAVIDFQKKNGLASDGIVGKNTFGRLY